MTDSPTRVAAQRWHHWVPGAAVALMAAAVTLLPGLAVAQDVYLRAGLDLSRPADTHFTDADCASMVPAALYGCGVGGDGAPLRSVGDVGTVAGVELGLGYAVAPAVRLEALLTSRPRFTFDGYANFLAPTVSNPCPWICPRCPESWPCMWISPAWGCARSAR